MAESNLRPEYPHQTAYGSIGLLTAEVYDLKFECEKLRIQNSHQQITLQMQQSELQSVKNTLRDLTSDYRKLKIQNHGQKVELEQQQILIKRQQFELDRQKSELQRRLSDIDSFRNAVTQGLRTSNNLVRSLENQNDLLKKELYILQSIVASQNDKIQRLESKCEQQDSEIKTLQDTSLLELLVSPDETPNDSIVCEADSQIKIFSPLEIACDSMQTDILNSSEMDSVSKLSTGHCFEETTDEMLNLQGLSHAGVLE